MNEDTLVRIGRAHQGDKEARESLFRENTGLIYSVVKRFLGRGTEMEDLFQIGSIGLLKAVDKFDLSYDVEFSTYAVPLIVGEIKRFLRDDGMVKVSRSIKENQYKIYKAKEELERKLGREPEIQELSAVLKISPEELVMAVEASADVESIYRTIHQGESTDLQLIDKIPEKRDEQQKLLDRIFLEELLTRLDRDERRLICMRYFKDMTQTEIAAALGISQVQVSRMEKRILNHMREHCEK